MSFQAMAWAVKQKTGDALGRALLMTLANYADEHGKCWPSLSRLAEDCEMHRASVIRKLEQLCERGLIAREQKPTPAGTYNVYTLLLTATPSRTQQPPQSHTATPPVAHSDPILSDEPIKEPVTGKNIGKPVDELMRVLSEETAQAIVDHRKASGSPLTLRAAKDLAKRLSEYHDPEEGASEMMVRGWRGFKAAWMQNTNTTSRKPVHDKRSEFLDALDGRQAGFIDGEFTVESPGRGLRVVS